MWKWQNLLGICNIGRCTWMTTSVSTCVNAAKYSLIEERHHFPGAKCFFQNTVNQWAWKRDILFQHLWFQNHVSKLNNYIQKYNVTGGFPSLKFSLIRANGWLCNDLLFFVLLIQLIVKILHCFLSFSISMWCKCIHIFIEAGRQLHLWLELNLFITQDRCDNIQVLSCEM